MFILRHRKSPLHSIVFSPNGQTLAAGGTQGTLPVWTLATQTLLTSFATGRYATNRVLLCRPETDGVLVLYYGRLFLNPLQGDSIRRWPSGNQGYARTAAATADGARVCVGINQSPRSLLEQFTLPECERTWKRQPRFARHVTALAYSADGRFLASGRDSGGVALCDAHTGAVLAGPDGAPSEVRAIAVSPNGRFVAWCAATQLHLWHREPLEQILRHSIGRTFFLSVAFHPSGEFLATTNGDGKVDYWDAASGERRESYDWGVGKVNGVAFDAAGDRAACCAESGQVVVWDVDR